MLDNDFLAGGLLIRTNLLLVYVRKCLIFYVYVWFDQFILVRNIHFMVKMSYLNLKMLKNDRLLW